MSSTLRSYESPSDEMQTRDLAGDTASDDETRAGAVISGHRGDNTDHNTDQPDPADTGSLIGVAIMCLLLSLGWSHRPINSHDRYDSQLFPGAVFGFLLKYRTELVIRQPSLPGLGLVWPKQPGLLVAEELAPPSLAAASLENDNYHAGPEFLASMFSVSDESEGSSSPGSRESPREQEEEERGQRGRLGQAVDRVRSGLNTTSGFQRF